MAEDKEKQDNNGKWGYWIFCIGVGLPIFWQFATVTSSIELKNRMTADEIAINSRTWIDKDGSSESGETFCQEKGYDISVDESEDQYQCSLKVPDKYDWKRED